MTRRRSFAAAAGTVAIALALAAGATANSAWRFITIGRNQAAVFNPSSWSCNNYGARVECHTGDAFPYAILTSSRTRGVTVKVVQLGGGQSGSIRRTHDRQGHPVYVFSAF